MKSRKNLLKIITCAFFVSGYNEAEKIIKHKHKHKPRPQPPEEDYNNKLTSVFK